MENKDQMSSVTASDWKDAMVYAKAYDNAVSRQIKELTPRNGDWLQTFRGIEFYPLDPRVEEIDIFDIAHALSNLCRFGGHSSHFYSVAEHSIRVSGLLPPELKLGGLLHDATEAYLVDVPRPIKRFLDNYTHIEDRLADCISKRFSRFGLPLLDFKDPQIKTADNTMLMTEAAQLLGPHPKPWGMEDIKPLDIKIECLSPAIAKLRFIDTFTTLYHAQELYQPDL